MKQLIDTLTLLTSITAALVPAIVAEKSDSPVTVLNLPGSGTDPAAIDYQSLPVLKGEHAIINPAALGPYPRKSDKIDLRDLRLNLHNYLIYHDGKFWCIWMRRPPHRRRTDPGNQVRHQRRWSPLERSKIGYRHSQTAPRLHRPRSLASRWSTADVSSQIPGTRRLRPSG